MDFMQTTLGHNAMKPNPYIAIHLAITAGLWFMIIALAGCASQPHTPTGTMVKAAAGNVSTATKLSTDARSAVLDAKRELNSPEPNTTTIRLRLNQADTLLRKQHAELQLAHTSLAEAEHLSALTAKELTRLQRESEKYRQRYESLKKYRWAIVGMALWCVIKGFGALGAWSPRGRVTRFLVG